MQQLWQEHSPWGLGLGTGGKPVHVQHRQACSEGRLVAGEVAYGAVKRGALRQGTRLLTAQGAHLCGSLPDNCKSLGPCLHMCSSSHLTTQDLSLSYYVIVAVVRLSVSDYACNE